MVHRLTMAVVMSLVASAATADDFFELMDAEPGRESRGADRALDFSGSLTHRYHHALTEQTDELPFRRTDTGPASIRYDLLLQARYRFRNNVRLQLAGLASHDTELERSTYVEMDQTYLEWGMTPSLNLKVGRQLISLGESTFFQIADRINPVDERAFGLAELRETLLPVAATRLSHYQSRWGIDLIALHEFRPNQYDEPFGDFDPYIEFRALPQAIEEQRPDVSLSAPDIAGRLLWSRPWGDMAVFASRMHTRQARPIRSDADHLNLAYPQVTLLGASANRVLGDWLLKSEYAYSDGELYLLERNDELAAQACCDPSIESRAHQWMVGGRFTGTPNLTLDFELLGSRIESADAALGEERTQVKGVASVEYEMLNDDLVANLTYMGWASNQASMVRVRLDYVLRDEIVVFAGAVRYSASSDESMLAPYRNNDRLFIGATFSF